MDECDPTPIDDIQNQLKLFLRELSTQAATGELMGIACTLQYSNGIILIQTEGYYLSIHQMSGHVDDLKDLVRSLDE